ncbi:hypothetical protein ACOTZF_24975 [Enterobacter cloacae complex sp. SHL021]|uniref:hypothetical protein n=1 Tax=Enterobacter cloacae complex sp. SHL021 TaxID=3412402 RepID=UPI003B9D2D61
MSTFTKEQLIEQAKKNIEVLRGAVEKIPGASDAAVIHLKLAEITLASLEAEAVCVIDQSNLDYLKSGSDADVWPASRTEMGDVLLYRAAPPAPASVPDDVTAEDCPAFIKYDLTEVDEAWARGFNACRDAMLQGAEPVTTAYKLPEGWVAVPVEPTEDMIVNGFESEPDESFSDADVWEAYESMSGCQQAAHRAKLCWAAMIAAAPKQEVK